MSAVAVSKPAAWIRLARLQFYPMVMITYGAGAAIAAFRTGQFDWTSCVLAWLCLFLIELATVMTNEYVDRPSDAVNHNAGFFTGGSRMLVDGPLEPRQVRSAVFVVLALLTVVAATLVWTLPATHRAVVSLWLALGLTLGIGYTASPLKLSYRGLGELNVAYTHSAYVLIVGFVVQTGLASDPLPWMVAIPSFFAVFSANTLAGIPDHAADASVNKRSLSVLLGQRTAAAIAIAAAAFAGATGLLLFFRGVIAGRIGWLFIPAAAHAIVLALILFGFVRSRDYDRRIDQIMINALNFIVWFGAIPLAYYLQK